MTQESVCISAKYVEESILLVRSKKVILDRVLAGFYGVSTSALNQAVKRNPDRFPTDFRFQLTIEETRALKRAGDQGKHVKYRPYVYTEHGILMLSTVLRNERAVQINIQIVRTFVRLREVLPSTEELVRRLEELRQLMMPAVRKRNRIGFLAKIPRK